MHASRLSLLLPIALLSPVAGATHVHDVPTSAPAATTAARYPTDATLREAMDGVRNGVEAFAHARHGHMGPAQVRALADHLDSQVARVFRDCELAPEADSSMHMLLLTILAADRAMRETPGDFGPVDAMDRAIADYARLFDDPGARAAAQR
jgi:hypothetical protein